MRHKYRAQALILSRSPLGEANAYLTIATPEVGLIRARAQGVRRSGARLAAALATFAESEVTLVRGAEGWRVVGAELSRSWGRELPRAARARAARITGLLLRLTPGDDADPAPYHVLTETLFAFVGAPEDLYEAIECRAVLRLLAALGLDDGAIPAIEEVGRTRSPLIARINRGIELSGL